MTVYYKGQELVAGKDYTLRYSNNKKVADQSQAKAPTVTIKGKATLRERARLHLVFYLKM